jgi:hypothetical protein
VRAAGRRTVVLQLTKAGRRQLARAGRARVRVRVTFTAAGGARTTRDLTAALKGGAR